MSRLASEAGCAVGLLYKVFVDREEIVIEVAASELGDLGSRMASWAAEAGSGSVSENLNRYASILLDSGTPALAHAESISGERLRARLAESAEASAFFESLDTAVADYLALEQQNGRVREDVDATAFGFAITGAIHNLVASGPAYPSPDREELSRYLGAIAAAIAPVQSGSV